MSKRIQATDVRQSLLDVAPSLIETADLLARGELKDYEGNAQMLQALLRLVSPIVALEDDAVKMDIQTEWTTEDRIDAVMSAMMSGAISLPQARGMVDVIARATDQIDAKEIKDALQRLADAA